MSRGGELTTARLAHLLGVSLPTAWRILTRLEREHPTVVRRRGRELVIARKDYDRLATLDLQKFVGSMRRRVADLERARDEHDRRIDGLSRDVIDTRRECRRQAAMGGDPAGRRS